LVTPIVDSVFCAGGALRAAISAGSPHSLMKPAAAE
jgi:hypothetical protein